MSVDVNRWIKPSEEGDDIITPLGWYDHGFPTSRFQHLCYNLWGSNRLLLDDCRFKADFYALLANPDLDVNYESKLFQMPFAPPRSMRYYPGTTSFIYLMMGTDNMIDYYNETPVLSDNVRTQLLERFDMIKALVSRPDLDINSVLTANEFRTLDYEDAFETWQPPSTALTWFINRWRLSRLSTCHDGYGHHLDKGLKEAIRNVIKAIATHPHIAPTPEEIALCAEQGVVVLPRPVRLLNKWRKACRGLRISLFWWKIAGEGQHAPGGRGEKRSREEFEAFEAFNAGE